MSAVEPGMRAKPVAAGAAAGTAAMHVGEAEAAALRAEVSALTAEV
jgi:hypothetical protein